MYGIQQFADWLQARGMIDINHPEQVLRNRVISLGWPGLFSPDLVKQEVVFFRFLWYNSEKRSI